MSNSPLVEFTRISPNSTNPRNHKIDTIVIHHMAGNQSIESCGAGFADPARQASSNYAIGSDGRVGMYVEEANRSWCSSNREVDHRAITIECANDGGSPDWHVSDAALTKLIDLCTDICKRNGIPQLNFTGDKTGNLTMHKYYAATACPGPYLGGKFPYIAQEVNKRLGAATEQQPDTENDNCQKIYRVQVGAFTDKSNAQKLLANLKEDGYDGFIVTSEAPCENESKSVDQIANEVIQGKWGDGEDRKTRLEAAGYDYAAVQSRVNDLMKK